MKWIHDKDFDRFQSEDNGLGHRYTVSWSSPYWRAEVAQIDLIRPAKILGAEFPGYEEAMNACCLDAGRAPGFNEIVVVEDD